MKSCLDCFNLIAKIPLKAKKKNESILTKQINYLRATAKCKQGHLLKTNGEERTFKNVLKNCNPRLSFKEAEKCPDYCGD
jgi:hypothetical protein